MTVNFWLFLSLACPQPCSPLLIFAHLNYSLNTTFNRPSIVFLLLLFCFLPCACLGGKEGKGLRGLETSFTAQPYLEWKGDLSSGEGAHERKWTEAISVNAFSTGPHMHLWPFTGNDGCHFSKLKLDFLFPPPPVGKNGFVTFTHSMLEASPKVL